MKFSQFIPLTIFSLLSLFLLIKLVNFESSKSLSSALINKPFPNISLPSLKKNTNIKQFIGKRKLAINFFASWCVPCKTEHAVLTEFSDDFFIIGIAYKDKKEKVNKFLLDLGNPYKEIFIDLTGQSAIELGLYGVPETYFVDEYGIIKYKHVGPVNRKQFKDYILKMRNL